MPNSPGRSARSHAAILQAALDLCAERGYSAVTMEAIAQRARVGKPTLYRWWPSKGKLFLAVLTERLGEPYFAIGDTGDLVADLRRWLHGVVDELTDPVLGDVVAWVAGTAQHDTELATILQEQIDNLLSGRNQERIGAGPRDGQLASLEPLLVEDLLVAPLWYRRMISGRPLTRAYADTVLDTLLGIHGTPPSGTAGKAGTAGTAGKAGKAGTAGTAGKAGKDETAEA
ncbi:Transcriptional regulator, TetR family [Streptomyces sp. YIM 130001]|uniref:TetR/AcrR family transcriptional regulator n=1 Tax=Streptomyces sp. YIM 130001 TaxID=2259644 RepID=UPI000E654248|nr:TetR/AcrR family transcriptional regulator [Streptomyces sp. YIM 130001]RII20318.1 Transcriptional regulator, TetR family [Streptomyces sp. YIM 130001]